MTKRFVAIVLAVWMSSAALVVFPANAADPKPHILGGGLFGPGQDVQSGPMNPANAATFVFYSTNNPAHTLLVGATNFTPANGVEPAIWGRNIESWDWTFGDTIVAIAETRRGVNGWSGVNYTTSIDDIIDDPNTTENAGDGTLAAIPTLSPTFGPDWVRLNWALIADTHGNVVSYEVFHGTSASSPPSTPVDRVTHGGMPFTNQSGLTPGLHCFAIGVNYRRENPPSTSVYTTTGLSEPVCKSVVEVAPKITQTTPIDGTTGVALNAPIIIDFSEPMDRPTVVANPMPPVIGGFTYVWSNENRTLTLTHGTNFDPCSRYDVTVTGSDRTGNALVSGFVPNPFHFWTQCPAPSIDKTTPANGAQRVRTDGTIVIEFSEPMQPSTVQFQITPGLVNSPTWNSPTNDVLTITPSQGFAETTTYTIQVLAGQDLDGNDLVGGAAINPWSFKTNTKPNVVIGPSLGGICVPGGSILNIPWTMSDGPAEAPETPPNLLSVKISTTGETSGVINGSWAGWIAPFSYPWSTPNTVNGIVQILIEVTDDVPGETERDTSGMIEIDSTAPSVPTNG